MSKRIAVTLAIGIFVVISAGLALLAEPLINVVLSRYPGAVRVEGENFDTYYLSHGWLTRRAAYQSPDDLINVTRWYAAYLPLADMHEAGICVALRQSRTFIHILHNISVLLCQLPPGTRIVVQGNIYLSP